MALDTTKILLLGGLAAAGYFVFTKFGRQAATEMAEDLTTIAERAATAHDPEEVAAAYQGAQRTLAMVMTPKVLPDGSLLFMPVVSPPPEYDIYDVVVKKFDKSWWDLYIENGSKGPKPLSSSGGFNYNRKYPIARIYFFNRASGREVAAWELRRDAEKKGLWLPDMAKALESYWPNAFNYACGIQPAYRQWSNTLVVKWASSKNWVFDNINCAGQYPVTL